MRLFEDHSGVCLTKKDASISPHPATAVDGRQVRQIPRKRSFTSIGELAGRATHWRGR